MTRTTWILSLTTSIAVCGCGGSKPPPPPPPTTVSAKLIAAADLNPDGTGAPEPLRVRVMQLTGTGALSQADFFTFDQDPAKALGPDLLGIEDVVLKTGQTVSVTPAVKPEIRFIGVAGAYYAIDKAHWRAWAPVKPNMANNFTVKLNAADITITETGG
jgi:type VI secretion system protein VasD